MTGAGAESTRSIVTPFGQVTDNNLDNLPGCKVTSPEVV
jgi:hypothetical protein